jgi:hypothetical protein
LIDVNQLLKLIELHKLRDECRRVERIGRVLRSQLSDQELDKRIPS